MLATLNFAYPPLYLPLDNVTLAVSYIKHRHARRAGVIFFVNNKSLKVVNNACQSKVLQDNLALSTGLIM